MAGSTRAGLHHSNFQYLPGAKNGGFKGKMAEKRPTSRPKKKSTILEGKQKLNNGESEKPAHRRTPGEKKI